MLTHEVAAGDQTVGMSSPMLSNAAPEASDVITTSIGCPSNEGDVSSYRHAISAITALLLDELNTVTRMDEDPSCGSICSVTSCGPQASGQTVRAPSTSMPPTRSVLRTGTRSERFLRRASIRCIIGHGPCPFNGDAREGADMARDELAISGANHNPGVS